MENQNGRWNITPEIFGPLMPYILDDKVTDINYNGVDTWIDDLSKGRYKAPECSSLPESFISQLTTRVQNAVSANFTKYDNLLEAETQALRISIIHESVARTGKSISIRKTPATVRLNSEMMLKEGYCPAEVIKLLEHCVKSHLNIVFCGLPGTGKTELLKFCTRYIPDYERVITIEDNLEIHYREINPGKDCVELKVDESNPERPLFSYIKAIKACLRQNPKWIILSEARSREVKYLLESMSTGTHCLTTLHTDDVRKIPDRIQNMIPDGADASRLDNDIHSFINMGILLRKRECPDGRIKRYIDQICFFSRENGSNIVRLVVNDGKIVSDELPEQIKLKFLHETGSLPMLGGNYER